jgi:hypothetical protein
VCCSLHARVYAAEELIRSIFVKSGQHCPRGAEEG